MSSGLLLICIESHGIGNQENNLHRKIYLYHLDKAWSEYLAELEYIRERIYLIIPSVRGPLVEFNQQAFMLFDKITKEAEHESLNTFSKIDPDNIDPESLGIKAPSATWIYMTNDNSLNREFWVQYIKSSLAKKRKGIIKPVQDLTARLRRIKSAFTKT